MSLLLTWVLAGVLAWLVLSPVLGWLIGRHLREPECTRCEHPADWHTAGHCIGDIWTPDDCDCRHYERTPQHGSAS